jgi:hypothetical protein
MMMSILTLCLALKAIEGIGLTIFSQAYIAAGLAIDTFWRIFFAYRF